MAKHSANTRAVVPLVAGIHIRPTNHGHKALERLAAAVGVLAEAGPRSQGHYGPQRHPHIMRSRTPSAQSTPPDNHGHHMSEDSSEISIRHVRDRLGALERSGYGSTATQG
jgi:hypothetical protein